jgi:acyl dehydratase
MAPLILETPHSLKEFVGKEIGLTEWFTVSQERIQKFAETTEDRQWIHVDRERARRESPFGGTIAHGFLTLSLLSHLVKQVVQVRSGVRLSVNYGLNRVRFTAPVPADSKIRARVTVQSVKEFPGGLEAVLGVSVEGEKTGKPCCVAEWVVRHYS